MTHFQIVSSTIPLCLLIMSCSPVDSGRYMDLSMIINMLNHQEARIKTLDEDVKAVQNSFVDQFRKMTEGMLAMNEELKRLSNTVTSMKKNKGYAYISVESQGCNDPGKSDNCMKCRSTIFVDGVDRSLHRRGHNFVVVDERTGNFESAISFDTHYGKSQVNSDMKKFIDQLSVGKIVVAAVQDEGTGSLYDEGIKGLESLGAVDPKGIGIRGSFAFIGYKGKNRPAWVRQVMNKSGEGPSKLNTIIPLSHD